LTLRALRLVVPLVLFALVILCAHAAAR